MLLDSITLNSQVYFRFQTIDYVIALFSKEIAQINIAGY
jgi:hypothetical protein